MLNLIAILSGLLCCIYGIHVMRFYKEDELSRFIGLVCSLVGITVTFGVASIYIISNIALGSLIPTQVYRVLAKLCTVLMIGAAVILTYGLKAKQRKSEVIGAIGVILGGLGTAALLGCYTVSSVHYLMLP